MPILALAVISALVLGVLGGLGRLGGLASWPLPPAAIGLHGPLMVLGFLGTVISIERAKAFAKPWGYLAPVLNLVGVGLLFFGIPAAGPLVLGGNLVLALILGSFLRRHPSLDSVMLFYAALALILGNASYFLGQSVLQAAYWWIGFLVLTIAGERLELGRLLRISRLSLGAFVMMTILLGFGAMAHTLGASAGAYPFGAGLLGLSLWLMFNDVARRTIRIPGLPRFIAVCLLSGNAWLGVAGALFLIQGAPVGAGPVYDAILHAVFVGFVFSMIFGHAPVILPAVAGIAVPFRRYFYIHLALLHLSLALRLTGDFGGGGEIRYLGALGNGLVLALFLGGTAFSALLGRRAPPSVIRLTG